MDGFRLSAFLSTVALAFALVVPGIAAERGGKDVQNEGKDFTAHLPDGFEIKKNEGPDFDVYDIQKGTMVYVGVYVGMYPNFPGQKEPGDDGKPLPNPVPYSEKGSDGKTRVTQYLWHDYDKRIEEMQMHVFVNDAADLDLAAEIAKSVHPVASH